MFKGNFIQNLPKIYGTYTGGFIVFIILMAIAEQAGVSAKNIGVMFVATNITPMFFADTPACSAIAIKMMKTIKPPV